MNRSNVRRLCLISCALAVSATTLLSWTALGHHTFAYDYNTSQVSEIEGEVVELHWQNPHIGIRIRTSGGDIWSIESNSPGGMERRTIQPEALRIGQRIKLAGFPARDGSHSIHASNILFADGREVVLRPGSKPRWGSTTNAPSSTVRPSATEN